VLRAQAAVERAAVPHLRLQLERERPRFVVAELLHIELRIGVDERFEAAVLGAALAQHDFVVADVHFRTHDPLAQRADRPRELEEDLVALCPHLPLFDSARARMDSVRLMGAYDLASASA
jgi:hypothetical protein